MKKAGIVTLLAIFADTQLAAQKKYVADPSATVIKWHGEKIVGSAHDGTINLREGWLNSDGKSITGGEFVVDMASITFDRSLYDVRFGSGKFFSNLGKNAIRDEIKLDVSLVVQ
jgi:polyisoprenoid-binding protein YceI